MKTTLLEDLNDLVFVFRPERLHCDAKFHRGAAIDRNKLIVLQFDDVSAGLSDESGNAVQFARLVGQKDRDGKNAVPQDQSLLDDRRHCDDIHVAPAQDAYDFFVGAVYMAQGGYCQKS